MQAQAGGVFRAELAASMRPGVGEASNRMQAAIPVSLPRGGGLASDVLGGTTFDASTSDRVAYVEGRVQVTSQYDIEQMNTGSFFHPVWGGSTWVQQSAGVTGGFLDDAWRQSLPGIEASCLGAVAVTREELYRSA